MSLSRKNDCTAQKKPQHIQRSSLTILSHIDIRKYGKVEWTAFRATQVRYYHMPKKSWRTILAYKGDDINVKGNTVSPVPKHARGVMPAIASTLRFSRPIIVGERLYNSEKAATHTTKLIDDIVARWHTKIWQSRMNSVSCSASTILSNVEETKMTILTCKGDDISVQGNAVSPSHVSWKLWTELARYYRKSNMFSPTNS